MHKRAIYFDVDGLGLSRIPARLSDLNWTLDSSSDLQEAKRKAARQQYHVGLAVLSDRAFESKIHELLEQTRQTNWIALVSKNQLSNPIAASLIRENCFDFHTLPLDAHRLAITLGRADGMAQLSSQAARTQTHGTAVGSTHGMLGSSEVMQAFYRRLELVAASGLDVLIVGESGSGKELAARAIHAKTSKGDSPFVPVSCNALSEQLLYSELFGHERGAFSGAFEKKIGKFELAHRGSLLLDEVGDMPLSQQPHLLRFLSERTLVRLGSTRTQIVDTRIICTTNQDLRQMVDSGRLREDLYYRINGVSVHVPPLRERIGDIELLANNFLAEYCRVSGTQCRRGFSHDALRMLNTYEWPGNVRELKNTVRRSAILHKGRCIRPQDLRLHRPALEKVPLLEEARSKAESKTIRHAIQRSYGNLSQAARAVGLSRVSFYRLMRKHNLSSSA